MFHLIHLIRGECVMRQQCVGILEYAVTCVDTSGLHL